jgi:hypothetical protein
MGPSYLLAAALVLTGCKPREKVVTLWATAEAKGTVAPCGCNSDPLGGLDRMAKLVQSAKVHALVDAGRLERDPNPDRPIGPAEADARAQLLTRTFARLGWLKPGVHEVGGIRIGVVDAMAGAAPPESPAGADFAVAVLHMPRPEARRALRRAKGIDLGVVGQAVGQGDPAPESVPDSGAHMVVPADQLQRVYRIELHQRKAGQPWTYVAGAGELAQLDARIAALSEQMAGWKAAQAGADPGFLAQKQNELDSLRSERASRGAKNVAPGEGNWWRAERIDVRQKLPADPAVTAEMKQLDRTVGAENRKRDCAAGRPPQVEPHYVGKDTCGKAGCHPQALAFWKTTVHAHAWQTLIDDGRAFSQDCFGCHVTGAGEPDRAGATLCHPEPFTDVQCEVCHGPGSAHVAAEGLEDKPTVHRAPPTNLCATRCHTQQHSDTFQLEAYLRDILGDGHGKTRRAALGPGPTGHELRHAALVKAGRAP